MPRHDRLTIDLPIRPCGALLQMARFLPTSSATERKERGNRAPAMIGTRKYALLGGIVLGAAIAGSLFLSAMYLFGTNAICVQGVLCKLAGYRNVGAARGIHLVGTPDPHTELAVVWETPALQDPPTVQYRRAGSSDWTSVAGTSVPAPSNNLVASAAAIHHARITGLQPGSRYEYRVSWDPRSTQRRYSPAFAAHTPARQAPIRLAFIADTCLQHRPDGLSGPIDAVMNQLRNEKLDLILGGGDYACALDDGRFATAEPAVQRFFDEWQPLFSAVPFIAQYGNHECCHGESIELWRARLHLAWAPYRTADARSYAFDLGNSRIVGLYGTGAQSTIDAAHVRWLERTLDDARRRGQQHLIVFQHAPLLGTGRTHPPDAAMQRQLVPLLQRQRVDLFLSAHDMSYERTAPLLGTAEGPWNIADSGASQSGWNGVVYAKISPTGRTTANEHNLGESRPPHIAVADQNRFYYVILALPADDGPLEYTAYAFDRQGRRSVIDRFSLDS